RVVGPIVQLREAAEALSSGDFSRRAGIHQANELGELGRTFDRMGESLERSLSSLQAEIEERQRAQEELAFEAMHDPLTGLPNRTLLTDRLSQAMAISQRSG